MAADEGLRKLSAIMAADVAGYSRLMADDERATVRTLTEYRDVFSDLVERHQGRIVDTAGDSVLATFDSVVEAVEAAVAVQLELKERNEALADHRRMRFRIGVNLGDIIVREDGSVYGDGVNVAARLESLAEPGAVMVSDFARQGVGSKIGVSFEDVGEHEVKNIPDAVRAFRVLTERDQSNSLQQSQKIGVPGLRIAAAVVLLVLASGGAWWFGFRDEMPEMVTAEGIPTDDPVLALPSGPSIAVLPFHNMTGSSEQEFFVDGITENIISGLAQFSNLFVVARNSTFQFKGTAVDVRDVASRLGVRFVLEGSVQRSNNQLRITTQLIDGENGSHLWAETYDRELNAENIFAIQDEITGHVASTLAGESGVITRHGNLTLDARRTDDLGAYECVLRSLDFFNVNYTPENHLAVTACLENAVKSAPNYVDAWAHLAMVHFFAGHAAKLNPGSDYLERGMAAARRALELDTTSQLAHRAMSVAHYFHGELEQFKSEAEEAIALNPHHADALAEIAQNLAFTGEWERGAALTRKAMALNPMHPDWWWFTMAKYHLVKGEFDQAVAAAQKINLEDYWVTQMTRAYIFAHAGRLSDAQRAVDAFIALRPDASIETAIKYYELWQFEPHYIEAYVAAGLRIAGLAETTVDSNRPVIAVLPFDNMSGDPEQEYFADGISEDIITRLAQYPNILVLGRNTTFQFKGEAVDVPTIAEKLGADYVVEGSIRRGGDTVRVTTQLLGGDEWGHLWAQTYDRTLNPANLFAVQDEITEAVASRIGDPYGLIGRHELRISQRQTPEHLSSYECVLRYFEYVRDLSAEGHKRVLNCLTRVVEDEPDYGLARAFLGDVQIDDVAFGFASSPDSSLDTALAHVEQSLRSDPGSARVRIRWARALFFTGKYDRARAEAERALEISPNDTDVISIASEVFNHSGLYERSQELFDRVVTMNPNYPLWMNWHPYRYHMARGEYAEAVRWLEMAQMDWNYVYNTNLAAAHCAGGDLARGREYLAIALDQQPELEGDFWRRLHFWHKGPDVEPLLDAYTAGLAACGWAPPPDPGPAAFAQ